MHNIPPELQAIQPPSSTSECLEIATTILKFENAVEKYKVYQAQQFFMNNIKKFSKEEFTKIVSNNLFVRKYTGQSAYDILDFCVENEITYPVILNSWFDKKVSHQKQKDYLKLLNKEDNKEQIIAFHEHLPNMIGYIFSDLENPSTTIIDIALKSDPQNLFKIKSWNDDMIANWLKTNTDKSRNILHVGLNSKTLAGFVKSRKQLYTNIIEEYLNMTPATKESYAKSSFVFANTFNRYPIEYIALLEENYPELWKKQINLKMHIVGKETSTTLTGLQFILLNREDSLSYFVKSFSKYKDQVRVDVKTELGFYEKTVPFFEYCIATNNLQPLTLFNLNDDLNLEEKEMLVAAAFMYINGKNDKPDSYHSSKKKNTILENWYPEILMNCSNEQFNKYSKKIKEILKEDSGLQKVFSAIELERTLGKKTESSASKRVKL